MRMAQENSSWGYDRMVGALANLGHRVSDQTVGNVLQRHGIAPAPQIIFTDNGIIRVKGTSFCFPHRADRSKAVPGNCARQERLGGLQRSTRPEQHEYWLGLLF